MRNFFNKPLSFKGLLASSALAVALYSNSAMALTLKEAAAVALELNPEIGQAIENREAIEFELRQARGLYLPSIDLEGSAGVRRLDNPSRRALGVEDDALAPVEISGVITQKLFDGGARRAELERQAARVDSASLRVLERSEYITLQVAREYLEYLLQAEIVKESSANLKFHQGVAGNIGSSIAGGALTEADRQQAAERVLSAKARLQEAEEEMASAKIRFLKLVGKPLSNPQMPASLASYLPKDLDAAIGLARRANPRVHMAGADIDAADAMVDAARAKFYPEIYAEGRARIGNDIDGSAGDTNDLQARIVAKWNVYRGGIDKANEQEQIRRASEQRLVLHQIDREVEEAVREFVGTAFPAGVARKNLARAGRSEWQSRIVLPRTVCRRPTVPA